MTNTVPIAVIVAGLALFPAAVPRVHAGSTDAPGDIYIRACANCHGVNGRGGAPHLLAFDDPLPDFTDCSFTTREPDEDWAAIVHEGGPARAFVRMMPAFGEALSHGEIQQALSYIRSFCPDRSWPRGELNLPRPLVTEKAFPEDEVVLSSAATAGSVDTKFIYERRIGARNQIELVVPLSAHEQATAGSWSRGIGDVVFGGKRVLYHNLSRGRIVSAAAELILPSGSHARGLGKGTAVFEPFVTFGQIMPHGSFVQLQSGLELPADTDRAARELFWRIAAGRSFAQQRWGRTWSPMLEIIAAREVVSGTSIQWDAVPQLQVTLSTRQHVMANVGVRLPLNERSRSAQVLVYVLWDWFDGPLFEGW